MKPAPTLPQMRNRLKRIKDQKTAAAQFQSTIPTRAQLSKAARFRQWAANRAEKAIDRHERKGIRISKKQVAWSTSKLIGIRKIFRAYWKWRQSKHQRTMDKRVLKKGSAKESAQMTIAQQRQSLQIDAKEMNRQAERETQAYRRELLEFATQRPALATEVTALFTQLQTDNAAQPAGRKISARDLAALQGKIQTEASTTDLLDGTHRLILIFEGIEKARGAIAGGNIAAAKETVKKMAVLKDKAP